MVRNKPARWTVWMGLCVLTASCLAGEKQVQPALVPVPAGRFLMGGREADPPQEPREVEVTAFLMGRYEVTVEELAAWLNDAAPPGRAGSPQIARRDDRFQPVRGARRRPAAWVSFEDAQAYCRWRGDKSGRRVRLPTETEWEYAARGGIEGARFPWGWGAPEGRACFAGEAPRAVGSYPPNGFGLYDMAGNVFEWCVSDEAPGEAVARGGSWAERDPRFLRLYNRVKFPRTYRDADVGFRVVVEAE
ncbi:MAG: formylglycine-generating enzyme family protein [Verrucomicrobia bacterium]|nr:formylglycine-generating enzyme family protein [Verrucomicrobiota bacterium]MBU1910509.1 formylglycine-generating enzyme family protein [Verrucomicrobiota bacterium]